MCGSVLHIEVRLKVIHESELVRTHHCSTDCACGGDGASGRLVDDPVSIEVYECKMIFVCESGVLQGDSLVCLCTRHALHTPRIRFNFICREQNWNFIIWIFVVFICLKRRRMSGLN